MPQTNVNAMKHNWFSFPNHSHKLTNPFKKNATCHRFQVDMLMFMNWIVSQELLIIDQSVASNTLNKHKNVQIWGRQLKG